MPNKNKGPIIRVYDTENLPCKAAVWGPGKQYVGAKNILQHRALICGAWKDAGDSTVYYTPQVKFDRWGRPDDREVIECLVDGLSDADVIVAHNGDSFDLKMVNARAIYHRLGVIPPVQTVDTLKVARSKFRFESNRLDDLGEYLGLGRKAQVDYELWLRCLAGERAAIREMLEYNIQDVELLEAVYLTLRPYMTNHPNLGLLAGQIDTCPNCGTKGSLVRNGTRPAGRLSVKQRYYCKACGTWPTGTSQRATDSEGNKIEVR